MIIKSRIPRDLYYFAGSFIALLILLKIVFTNENILTVLNLVAAFFWIFVIPGLPLTYIYRKLNFIERFALSVVLGAALMGIGTYYTGLAGVHIRYSIVLLPIIYFSLFSSIFIWYKSRKKILKEII